MIKDEHEVYLCIRNQIFEGRIEVDSFINIKRLSKNLNVSALPIREALIRLSSEDLLDYSRSRGYFLPKLEYETIINAYTNMYVIAKYSIIYMINNSVYLTPNRLRLISKNQFDWKTLQPHNFDEFLEVAAATIMNENSCRLFLHETRRTRPFRYCIEKYRNDTEELYMILNDIQLSIMKQDYRLTINIIKKLKNHINRYLKEHYRIYNEIVRISNL